MYTEYANYIVKGQKSKAAYIKLKMKKKTKTKIAFPLLGKQDKSGKKKLQTFRKQIEALLIV